MKESDILSPVAAGTSLSGAAADIAVNAVFAALTGAVPKSETVAITGFGTFSTTGRAAREAEGRTPQRNHHRSIPRESASKWPSRPQRHPRVIQATPSATPSTGGCGEDRARFDARAWHCRLSPDRRYPPLWHLQPQFSGLVGESAGTCPSISGAPAPATGARFDAPDRNRARFQTAFTIPPTVPTRPASIDERAACRRDLYSSYVDRARRQIRNPVECVSPLHTDQELNHNRRIPP